MTVDLSVLQKHEVVTNEAEGPRGKWFPSQQRQRGLYTPTPPV